MFSKISFFCLCLVSLFGIEHVYLTTPNLSESEITGTNVGIRPYRKTGIRLEPEWIQDKLIIHNYGYGGSGLTLSFGGANQVLEILNHQNTTSKVVAVLGAGVVGLATTYDLLEKGYEVHLYSDQWNPHLTSNVAAGIWSPYGFSSKLSEEQNNLHEQMLETSQQRFVKSTTDEPEFAGIKMMAYYKLIGDAYSNTESTKDVIIHFDNGFITNGRRTYRLGIDGKLFMDDLYSKVKNKGAILQQKHFENIEELLNLEEPIIVNCMSMGSRHLFDDQEFIPVRGQLVYFNAQEGVDYLLFQSVPDPGYFFSLYPWSDRLIISGVYEVGEENCVTDPDTINKLIEQARRCLEVVPNQNNSEQSRRS